MPVTVKINKINFNIKQVIFAHTHCASDDIFCLLLAVSVVDEFVVERNGFSQRIPVQVVFDHIPSYFFVENLNFENFQFIDIIMDFTEKAKYP